MTYRRFYNIAGITIQLDSDLPFTDSTFHPKFNDFRTEGPGDETIRIHHHFSLPDMEGVQLGREVYRALPWAVYKNGEKLTYLGLSRGADNSNLARVVFVNKEHTIAHIHNRHPEGFSEKELESLTIFPTDQVLLAPMLAFRQSCILHSAGAAFQNNGLLFVGHSDAGKSTMASMLKERWDILCDDRIIVRRRTDGFSIHGTWCHGDVPDISPGSAPLRAIMFLEKAPENRLFPMADKGMIIRKLLACMVRALATAEWWERILGLVEIMARETPCYILRFDKSGRAGELLQPWTR